MALTISNDFASLKDAEPFLNLPLCFHALFAVHASPVEPLECLAVCVTRLQVPLQLHQDASLALVQLPLQLLCSNSINCLLGQAS